MINRPEKIFCENMDIICDVVLKSNTDKVRKLCAVMCIWNFHPCVNLTVYSDGHKSILISDLQEA